jgi:hypothetical protein
MADGPLSPLRRARDRSGPNDELREDNQARATQRVIRGAGVVYLLPLLTTDIVLDAGLSKRAANENQLGICVTLDRNRPGGLRVAAPC